LEDYQSLKGDVAQALEQLYQVLRAALKNEENIMAYSNFTLARVKKELGIEVVEGVSLFATVEPVRISDLLRQLLDREGGLATLINTEKARSEFLIAPILADVRQQSKRQVSLFSGSSFNVDMEKGLIEFCDFILSQSEEQIDVTTPMVMIVEAKNESVIGGLGQFLGVLLLPFR
jgi:hypothetical protein